MKKKSETKIMKITHSAKHISWFCSRVYQEYSGAGSMFIVRNATTDDLLVVLVRIMS